MKVKLIKGLSYYDIATGFSAKKDKIVDVDDSHGTTLVASGRFTEVKGSGLPDSAQTSNGAITTDSIKKKPVSNMNTAELEAYAKEKGIDISTCNTNNERIAAIKAAEGAAQTSNGATPGFEE